MMKILYILNYPNKHEGSIKSFCIMLKGLVAKGIKPFVIVPKDGNFCKILQDEGIPFAIISYYFFRYPPLRKRELLKSLLLYLPRFFRVLLVNRLAIYKLLKIIKNFNPDLVHTNVGPVNIGFEASKKSKIPHVWHLREYQILDFDMHPLFTMRGFQKRLNSSHNYCIAITKGIFEYFNLDSKSTVVYNGILENTDSPIIKDKEEYFLYAGRLEPNKGILDLILAFSKFARCCSNFKLYIAGDTKDQKYKKYLYDVVKINNIEDRVVFLGMCDNIYQEMASASAVIVPSVAEAFGRVTVEAMFNHCLVIGFKNAGTREILEPKNLGVLYENESELIEVLIDIANNGLIKYLPQISAAYETATSLYSSKNNIDSVYSFYQNIINIEVNHNKCHAI